MLHERIKTAGPEQCPSLWNSFAVKNVRIETCNCAGEFSCHFVTTSDAILLAVQFLATVCPNANICLKYEDLDLEFCGVVFAKNGNILNKEFSIDLVKDFWMQKFDKNLYLRANDDSAEDDEELEEDLDEYWGENECDAIDWIQGAALRVVREVIDNHEKMSERAFMKIGVQLVEN